MNRGLLRVRLLAWAGIGLSLMAPGRSSRQGQPQPAPPLPTINQSDDPILKTFVWRSIGPANMGGRIDDIAVVESNPSIYLRRVRDRRPVEDAPTTARPGRPSSTAAGLVDRRHRHRAVEPRHRLRRHRRAEQPPELVVRRRRLQVHRRRQDASKYIGLKETQSIARMVVHPKNPNIVYVAAVGHLFGPNPERGLYKTTDGGEDLDEHQVHRRGHRLHRRRDGSRRTRTSSYAASYQRRRAPWGFNGGGPGSGIWKTTDAAKTWTKLTGNGLPANPIIGRIGLDIARSKPSTIYASIEVGPSGGTGAGVNDDGTLAAPGQGAAAVAADAAARLPPPDPNKSGIWRSRRRGKTWKFLSNTHAIARCTTARSAIDPTNPEIAYQGGAPFFKTVDGGKTWRPGRRASRTAITTRSGSIRATTTTSWSATTAASTSPTTRARRGSSSTRWRLGQFYAISADMRKPYVVCGGLQDNGSWCGPSATRSSQRHPELRLVSASAAATASTPRAIPTDWTHRLLGIAGRRHEPARSADAADARRSGRAGRRAAAAAARRRRRPGDAGPGAVRPVPERPAATSCRRRRRARASASTGTRRSSCRRTTRDDLPRRRAAVQVVRPRRHVDGVAGSDAQHRPQRSADHGRRRQGADGVQARRRRVLQQHRHDQRIAARPGHRLGRHQRRQRAGEPRRRQDLEERRRQGARRAEGNARLARRSRRRSTPAPATSRSTDTAPTTTSRTSSRRRTSARRGRRSRRTCPRATST